MLILNTWHWLPYRQCWMNIDWTSSAIVFTNQVRGKISMHGSLLNAESPTRWQLMRLLLHIRLLLRLHNRWQILIKETWRDLLIVKKRHCILLMVSSILEKLAVFKLLIFELVTLSDVYVRLLLLCTLEECSFWRKVKRPIWSIKLRSVRLSYKFWILSLSLSTTSLLLPDIGTLSIVIVVCFLQ